MACNNIESHIKIPFNNAHAHTGMNCNNVHSHTGMNCNNIESHIGMNCNNVHSQINMKNLYTPYTSVGKNIPVITTKSNYLPHLGFYDYNDSSILSLVTEREAGIYNSRPCNKIPVIEDVEYPDHCFQTACSTTFPCHSAMRVKYTNKNIKDTSCCSTCFLNR